MAYNGAHIKATILILMNNVQASDLIAFELNRAGFYLVRAYNGREGLRRVHLRKPDIMLLDLPEGMDPDSFDVFDQMKNEGLDTETLTFVTEDEVDLAISFGMDYIVKPFSIHDLMNRISNISLRSEQIQRPIIQRLGRITVDIRRAIISKDNNPVELSLKDYDLFCFLSSQPGTVFKREDILVNVWGYITYLEHDIRLVDVAIRRLRMKIEDDPSKPQFIMTRRGNGYYFETSEKESGGK